MKQPKSLLPSDTLKIAMAVADLSRRVGLLESREIVLPGMLGLVRSTNQSIPDGIVNYTPIQWSSAQGGAGFTWASGSPTKIYSASQRDGERLILVGSITFASNNAGIRLAALRAYNTLDVLQETVALWVNDTCSASASVFPIAIPYWWSDPTDYLTIEVAQNSGGALNLTYAMLGLVIVR